MSKQVTNGQTVHNQKTKPKGNDFVQGCLGCLGIGLLLIIFVIFGGLFFSALNDGNPKSEKKEAVAVPTGSIEEQARKIITNQLGETTCTTRNSNCWTRKMKK